MKFQYIFIEKNYKNLFAFILQLFLRFFKKNLSLLYVTHLLH